MNEKAFQINPVENKKIVDQKKEEEPILEDKSEQLEEEIKGAKHFLGVVFETGETPEGREKHMTSRLEAYLDDERFNLDKENIILALKEACKLEDKEEFVNSVAEAMHPMIIAKMEHYREFEEIQRKGFIEAGGFTPVNEIISYGEGAPGWYHIHLAPAQTLSIGEQLRYLKDGMKKLAEMADNDESFNGLTATSWIVAKNPGIFERLGFEYKGDISQEKKERYFKHEERPVAEAIITKEQLIKKHLKKESNE